MFRKVIKQLGNGHSNCATPRTHGPIRSAFKSGIKKGNKLRKNSFPMVADMVKVWFFEVQNVSGHMISFCKDFGHPKYIGSKMTWRWWEDRWEDHNWPITIISSPHHIRRGSNWTSEPCTDGSTIPNFTCQVSRILLCRRKHCLSGLCLCVLLTRISSPSVCGSQVSNVLYRLHKSVLAARLDLFGGMFILSNGQWQPEDGQDDNHAVHIEDGIAVREDFEALIKHIYGQYVFLFFSHWDHQLNGHTRWTAPPYPVLNGRPASRVTEQPGTAHKRPDRPDHRMIRWVDLTWSVHHHSNTVQL